MRKTLFGILIFSLCITSVNAVAETESITSSNGEITGKVFFSDIPIVYKEEIAAPDIESASSASECPFEKNLEFSYLTANVSLEETAEVIFYLPVSTIYAGGGFYFSAYYSSSIIWYYVNEGRPKCTDLIDYIAHYTCGGIEIQKGCYLTQRISNRSYKLKYIGSYSNNCRIENFEEDYEDYEDTLYISDRVECRDPYNVWSYDNEETRNLSGHRGYTIECEEKRIENTNCTALIKDGNSEHIEEKMGIKNYIKDFKGTIDFSLSGNKSDKIDAEWDCRDSILNTTTFKEGEKFITSCYYNMSDASINRQTAEVTYDSNKINDTNYVDGGDKYYTDLNLKTENYFFNVEAKNLSRIIADVETTYSRQIDVEQRFYKEDEKGNFIGFNFLYRPIDITNPFPTNREIGDNWDNWYNKSDANKTRIANSYSKPEAKFTFNSLSEFKSSFGGMSDYLSFENISYDGTSNKVGKTTHSKLGELVKEGDDS